MINLLRQISLAILIRRTDYAILPRVRQSIDRLRVTLPRLRATHGPTATAELTAVPGPGAPNRCPWETTLRPAGVCSNNTPADLWAFVSSISSSRRLLNSPPLRGCGGRRLPSALAAAYGQLHRQRQTAARANP